RLLAGDRLLRAELLEQPEAPLEGLQEAVLLEAERAVDLVVMLPELRVRLAHLLGDDAGEPVDVVQADALGLLYRPADDAPQDVPAPLVRRGHAAAHHEGHAAAVVGEDAVRLRRRRRVAVRDTGLGCDPV